MTAAPHPECQPDIEHDNWLLHRQPADQIADHEFSIWSGEHPVVLANEYPGEDGILAFIVSELNSMDALKSRAEELTKALEWRPIETAPHAKRVLLGWRDWRDHQWCVEAGPATTGQRFTNGYSTLSQHGSATHWQPISEGPAMPLEDRK